MQSSSSPVQSPIPSNTAKTAGDPSVQSLHSARMSVSLVGSKLAMMGLIFRPLIPPLSLMWFTKRLMALVCSPNSASAANPSWPAKELRATTGKTTLMLAWSRPATRCWPSSPARAGRPSRASTGRSRPSSAKTMGTNTHRRRRPARQRQRPPTRAYGWPGDGARLLRHRAAPYIGLRSVIRIAPWAPTLDALAQSALSPGRRATL